MERSRITRQLVYCMLVVVGECRSVSEWVSVGAVEWV